MSYRWDKKGDVLKVILSPNITSNDFKNIVEELKSFDDIREVRLDLKSCEYIQSKVLTGFVQLNKFCKERSLNLILVNVNESIVQLLELTNLYSIFKIERDFTSYTPEELISFFEDVELADKVSDFIAENYNDNYKSLMKSLIKSDDPILKEYAILTVGKAHDYDFLEDVRAALQDEVGNVVKAAITVLGWFQDFESKEKIYPFLNSEFVDVAEAAAATIALLAEEDDAERLAELLERKDERLKKIVIQALTLINDDKCYKIVKRELETEKNELLIAYIIKMLSFFNKKEVEDILINYLSHNSNIVRETAASSLVRINAVSKIEDILKKVTDSDSMVGYFSTKAVGELCKDKSCADYLMKVYHSVAENVKLAIIEALGKIGADCADFLYQALSEKNEDIRKEALNSLYLVLGDKVKDIALECLKDESWLVRYKAVEVLGKINIADLENILNEHLKGESNKFVKEKIYSLLGEL
ncbi:STAS domain-containing protein [Deferribacter autotrophicus]|uniref:STAS domain-containing protein n=1 Tax=Deferribacter autotrophicus TaxID=500465 RepID=A0A5A8EZY1_9BACT|nr:HEAT repeat domain-containing protein [Deferribacter autotrophicus]KAA0257102.1 STAS domain-containing protein [Deferribacter autotrophicus]